MSDTEPSGVKAKAKAWFGSLVRNFTLRLMIFVALENFFIKGLTAQALDLTMLPFFIRVLDVGVIRYGKFETVAQMGWSMKPLLAALSDMVPVFGYRKRYYVVIYAFVGFCALLIANHLPHDPSSGTAASFVFFLASACIGGIGVLLEGQYSQMMVLNPKEGPRIVSWAWTWYTIGGIVGCTLEGTVLPNYNVLTVMWVVAPMFLVVVLPALLGWIPEGTSRAICAGGLREDGKIPSTYLEIRQLQSPPALRNPALVDVDSPRDVVTRWNTEVAHHDRPIQGGDCERIPSAGEISDVSTVAAGSPLLRDSVATVPSFELHEDAHWSQRNQYKKATLTIGVVLGLGTLCVVGLTLTEHGEGWVIMICNFCFALLVLVAMRRFLPRLVFAVGAFAFFKDVLFLHTFSILDVYMTAPATCVADAPHFDYQFYQFYANVVGNACSWLAIVLFQKCFINMKFHHAVWITTTIKSLSSLADICIVMRWNIAVGIPDEWAFMLGTGVMFHICSWLDFNVLLVLLSKACPRRVEATTFALLAGMLTLAESVSSAMAYKMAAGLDITTDSKSLHTKSGSGSSYSGSGSSGSSTGALCNFDNLPILLAVGHFVFPLAIYPLAYYVLPHRKMTDAVNAFHPNKDEGVETVEGEYTLDSS